MKELPILNEIAEIFFDYYLFFMDYKDFERLSVREIEELISIEFILEDIKEFSEDVFISKTSQNLNIYADLFKQSLEQLAVNIKNADREAEDCDDGELDFF